MQTHIYTLRSFFSLLGLGCAADGNSSIPSVKLDPIYLFSGRVTLGKNMTGIPAAPNAALPITGGYIEGPAINATITGGIAVPIFSQNFTVDNQRVQLYGTTDDCVPFFTECESIGITTAKWARCTVAIGERYKRLANTFVLAALTDNADITESYIEASGLSRTVGDIPLGDVCGSSKDRQRGHEALTSS